MNKRYVKWSILIGFITFAFCVVLLLFIDSPSPIIGSLVVAFIIFEISFYHLFTKERRQNRL